MLLLSGKNRSFPLLSFLRSSEVEPRAPTAHLSRPPTSVGFCIGSRDGWDGMGWGPRMRTGQADWLTEKATYWHPELAWGLRLCGWSDGGYECVCVRVALERSSPRCAGQVTAN